MKIRDLCDLLLLAAIWGASFLFMRIAAPEFGAGPLMAGRVAVASLILLPVLFFRNKGQQSHTPRQWRNFFVLGLVNSALPFLLFGYAAIFVTAGYSSILNATVPLWVALIAWL